MDPRAKRRNRVACTGCHALLAHLLATEAELRHERGCDIFMRTSLPLWQATRDCPAP